MKTPKIIKTSESLLKKILPPKWETHVREIGGLETEYFTIGRGDKKMLLLHGWSQSIEAQKSFFPLVEVLGKNKVLEEYTIFLPHYPGFGNSDFPPISGWDTFDYADWVESFISEVIFDEKNTNTGNSAPKITFMTHSFGGRILVRLLTKKQNPENQDSEKRTSISSEKNPENENFMADKNIMIASAGIKWPLSPRQKASIHISKKITRFKSYIPQKIQSFVLNKIFGARDWGAVSPELKPSLKKVIEEPDFREDLAKIPTPTLLLWGAKDSVTPLKSGEVFVKYLPQANLKVWEKGHHGIHKTDPESVGEVIAEFLKS